MIEELRELWRYRELLVVMVQRELRIRYKNSVLGILWSFVNPLLQVAVLTIIFGKILTKGAPDNFSAYVFAALLPFTFFQLAVLDSAQSVLVALPLVRKIYFPRELLPLSTVIANLIHLGLGFVVFFAYLLFAYVRNPSVVPFQATTVFLPVLAAITFMLSLGLAFIVAALNTFYEDVKYLVSVVMYLLVYLCPIMYLAEAVANSGANLRSGGLLYNLYSLNPMATLITGYRKILLAPTPVPTPTGTMASLPMRWDHIGYVALGSFGVLVFGYGLFNRFKWRFVERP